MKLAKEVLANLAAFAACEATGVRLDRDLYSVSSVKAAAAAFIDCCTVSLQDTNGDQVLLLHLPPEHQRDRSRIVQEFLNFALCEAVRAASLQQK